MDDRAREECRRINAELKERLMQRLPGPGDYQSDIASMLFLRREAASDSEKTFEKPMAAFVVQGSKLSYFGGREYFYEENQCLVAGIDMPASFRAMPATSDRPFLSVFFYLDAQLIKELSLEMAQKIPAWSGECEGVAVEETDPELLDVVLRLVRALDKPEQLPVRAPMLLRELHYFLLLSPYGPHLRQLNTTGTENNQIVQTIVWLRKNLARPVRVDDLARHANMSAATLHRHFKRLTGLSPLQYLKNLRLHEAQRLMLLEQERASSAALAVGYESVTQFNREYKKLFGDAPLRDIARRREQLLGEPARA